MLEEISFPEHEYESIQNYLNNLGYCYTTRVYKEIGKYKVGELYTAPWGDVLKIDEVKTYWKVSDRPFYDEMSDDERIEICKYSEDIGLPYEFIKFSKSTCELKVCSTKKPWNPTAPPALPAVPELSALCVIRAPALKGGKNVSGNNA